jgi:hypothetical protein
MLRINLWINQRFESLILNDDFGIAYIYPRDTPLEPDEAYSESIWILLRREKL